MPTGGTFPPLFNFTQQGDWRRRVGEKERERREGRGGREGGRDGEREGERERERERERESM